jgi:hypothetical protein
MNWGRCQRQIRRRREVAVSKVTAFGNPVYSLKRKPSPRRLTLEEVKRRLLDRQKDETDDD